MADTGFKKILWIILGILAVVDVAGINLIGALKDTPDFFPDPRNPFNAFFVTMAATEPAGLFILLAFVFITAWLWQAGKPRLPSLPFLSKIPYRCSVACLAAFSLVVSTAGYWLVMHHRALAADENMPDFQGLIFLTGKVSAEIPERLRPISHALQPLLSSFTDANHWDQSYLPVYAALRTPFLALHLENLVNPLFSALTVVAIAGIIRRIWPEKPLLAVAGAAFIAINSQILITGMSSYAMPAHLALNTFWLFLYLRPGFRSYWAVPVIGVLAIGLHSPFPHALFAAPFLVRLVLQERWKVVFGFGMIYGLGCVGWWTWWHYLAPLNTTPSASLFTIGGPLYLESQSFNFLNILSWNALPVPILAAVGLRYFKKLPLPVLDGTISCVLTFFFYATISFDQGYGWGNRYFYGVLGCLALLAVAGLNFWLEQGDDQCAWEFVKIGVFLSIFIQLPLRSWQVASFTRPFAKAQAAFARMDVDLVVFDPRMAWYSTDLRRNSPFLTNRPLIANFAKIDPASADQLHAFFPKIHLVTREELTSYGLATEYLHPPESSK